MGSVGIVRNTDSVGRITLPVALRRILDIQHDDRLAFVVDEDCLILQKCQSLCVFCGNTKVRRFKGKDVCAQCETAMKRLEDRS
ncbi:MAG: AbrB/MazE/SpoVT family DNA-binding domain-containing protein [Negativicutes bacterium]|nr:AbrB/MazE/SpoVT family DNA-binding domain-containing protein [Negativicutes bacterium]